MNLADLTVNERILLHLRDYLPKDDPSAAVMGQTQEGISEGVDIRINHIPRAVKKLLEDDYVSEYLAHIGGLKRKRKAYVLTEAGMKKANDMLDDLKGQDILVKYDNGQEALVKLSDVPLTVKTNATLSQIILNAYTHGHVIESILDADSEKDNFISNIDGLPDIGNFIGRKECLETLSFYIDSGRITVISGIKGIGKTSLARKVLSGYEGKSNILWFTANEWDNLRSFMEQISEPLGRADRDHIRRSLRSSRDIEPSIAFGALAKDMQGMDAIMVFDNIFNLQTELMHLVLMIMKSPEKFVSTHFIFITRDIGILRPGPVNDNNLNYITLDGFNPAEARKMLDSCGAEISDEDFDIIYGITHGHPLVLDLVCTEFIETSFDTKGLTREELLMVKCLKAFDSIFQ